MLADMLRRYRAALGISKEAGEAMEARNKALGIPTFSKDYRTLYIPFSGLSLGEVPVEETKMGKEYSFALPFSALTFGRGILMPNPKMGEFFHSFSYPAFIEQGETLVVTAKARKNSTAEEIEAAGWLLRMFILDK